MGTSPLSPEDIRAAVGAHHELGPEYSDTGDRAVAAVPPRLHRPVTGRVRDFDRQLAALLS